MTAAAAPAVARRQRRPHRGGHRVVPLDGGHRGRGRTEHGVERDGRVEAARPLMEVVQFRRDSSSGVVDDIEPAAIPLRGSPAALAADRDGPPRPRSATPLVRVGQHRGLEEGKEGAKGKQSIEGRATKEKKGKIFFCNRRLLLSPVRELSSLCLLLNSRGKAAEKRDRARDRGRNRREVSERSGARTEDSSGFLKNGGKKKN